MAFPVSARPGRVARGATVLRTRGAGAVGQSVSGQLGGSIAFD